MVPVCLRLKNFLSYRDEVPPLSFVGVHLACLSGDNGHGKSALLDAITWALWGEARAKSSEDLVHAAATDMEVEFQFLMDGTNYRVLRKQARARSSKESGRSALELHISRGDGFQPITGDNQRETQARINDLLHMDYQTFINSAFLLQGRADEFTKKGPADRKKVLADILGLSYYEGLEGRAKEEAKSREVRGEELRRILADIEAETAQRPHLEEELERARQELGSLEGQVKSQGTALGVLREEKKALDLKLGQVAEAERDLEQARDQGRRAEAQARKHEERIRGYEQALASGKDVERGFGLLASARQRVEELNDKLGVMLRVQERKAKLETTIREAHNALSTQEKMALNALAELEGRANTLPTLQQELAAAARQLQELYAREELAKETRRRALETAGQVQALKGENQKLHTEMLDLKERIDLLDRGHTSCPVCETELGETGLSTIRAKYLREGQARKEEYLRRQKEMQEVASLQTRLEKDAEAEEASIKKGQEATQRRMAAAERDKAEAEQASTRAAPVRQELQAVQARLTQDSYAQNERRELEQLVGEIAGLGYQRDEHQEVKNRLKELAPFEDRKKQLDEASLRIPQEHEALERASEAADLWRGRAQELEMKVQALRQDMQKHPALLQNIAEVQATLDVLERRHGVARQEVGACVQRLQHCRQLDEQKESRVNELAGVENDRAIYQELSVAFGKRGIQAMIIEAAIPELEGEANCLLSRMTEGRMQVKLETQRDTRKGTILETLDIRVSDELGTRAYELFSGGESFRINFALRVALSKLLVRRAGAQLKLLVIDEGFGTQDSQGKDRLVEAINSIQDDFEVILAITHIQELKDLFPVRIEVVKTVEGSTYYMN